MDHFTESPSFDSQNGNLPSARQRVVSGKLATSHTFAYLRICVHEFFDFWTSLRSFHLSYHEHFFPDFRTERLIDHFFERERENYVGNGDLTWSDKNIHFHQRKPRSNRTSQPISVCLNFSLFLFSSYILISYYCMIPIWFWSHFSEFSLEPFVKKKTGKRLSHYLASSMSSRV